ANFLPGTYDGRTVNVLGYAVEHEQDVPAGPVTVMVRPEAVEFARDGEPGLAASYRSSAYLGPTTEYVFDVAGSELFATISGGGLTAARRGDEVRLHLKAAGLSLLPAE